MICSEPGLRPFPLTFVLFVFFVSFVSFVLSSVPFAFSLLSRFRAEEKILTPSRGAA
jgi:hypothetical protein